MNVPPLCIIQARYNSTRLPGKMLLKLGDETLIARAWRIACEAFGQENVIVAIPFDDQAGPLGAELRRMQITVFSYEGDESDVLGRFYACAQSRSIAPNHVIVRLTAEDPFKDPALMTLVARKQAQSQVGYSRIVGLPLGCDVEAFTMETLDSAHRNATELWDREHVTPWMFRFVPHTDVDAEIKGQKWDRYVPCVKIERPWYKGGDIYDCANARNDTVTQLAWRWTIDTQADYDFAQRVIARLGDNSQTPSTAAIFALIASDRKLRDAMPLQDDLCTPKPRIYYGS